MQHDSNYTDARILIIDDEPINLKLLDIVLRSNGYSNLELIHQPELAIDAYQACRADIILLDLQMPVKDGFTLLAEFQALQDPLLPPIVVLTAYQQKEYRLNALQAGARDFLTKPFDHIELLARIRNLLEMQAHLCKVRQQNAILEQENQLAQHLYENLLGNTGHQLPGIACFHQAASLFSGDLLLAAVNATGSAGYVMLADAMGHGLTAAISLIPISMLFHAAVEKNSSLTELVTTLNFQLNKLLPEERFVAAIVIRCDFVNHTLSVWNGGMPPVLCIDMQHETISEFRSENMALGILPPSLFEGNVVQRALAFTEKLLMYSDGVTEAINTENTDFHEVFNQLRPSLYRTPSPIQQIEQALIAHIEGAAVNDDICLAQIDLALFAASLNRV